MTFWAELGRATVWAILIGLILWGYYSLMHRAIQKEIELAEARERKAYYVAVLEEYRKRTARTNRSIESVWDDEEAIPFRLDTPPNNEAA